jgi:CRP/FNR family transcriptional regulator, cyclic AMP receptor protein
VSNDPVQRTRLVRILHEDPDLARRIDERDVMLAARQTVGTLEEVPVGDWSPATLNQGKSLYGGLVLSGLLVRELSVAGGTSAELLGAGDLVLPLDADETVPFVVPETHWSVLERARIAWLDAPFGVALRRWPELGAVLLERSQRRFSRLALSQAVSQLTRVDERVLIELWHLAERWGRVRPDGVLLPVRLTHRVLGRLIGARRPSVTTAVGSLERRGLLTRQAAGGWLLHGSPPAALQRAAPEEPWRHRRTGAPGLERVDG